MAAHYKLRIQTQLAEGIVVNPQVKPLSQEVVGETTKEFVKSVNEMPNINCHNVMQPFLTLVMGIITWKSNSNGKILNFTANMCG